MKLPVRPVAFAAAMIALASCAEPVRVVVPGPEHVVATTPQSAVKLFEWAMVNRKPDVFDELFTDDFAFISSGTDSAGDPRREPHDRAWALAKLRCMLEGGAESPPAASIRLNFDRFLVPVADPRPGFRDADSLFKSIRTALDCKVEIGDGQTFEVTGYLLFYLVRGDAAAIPAELEARGVTKDKARWWISRWEDETLAHEGKQPSATNPTKSMTLGDILQLYDCPP